MNEVTVQSRVAGALLGFALGDCLGAPALPDRQAHVAQHGHINGPRRAPGTHPRWPALAAGRATWLGEQAQQLLPLLAEDKPWPPWSELSPLPGTDPALVMATGWPAALWGLHGLCWPGDPDEAARQALVAWRGPPLTTSARSAVGMVAAALAAAVAGNGAEDVLAAAQAGSLPGASGEPLGTAPSLPYRLQQTAAPLRAATDMEAQLQQLYDAPGASELAAEAIPTALALVRAVGAQPVWAALYAANLGGEAALIGAMAGAVAGAMAGEAGLPDAWLRVARGAWPDFRWDDVTRALASRISE